MKSYCHYNTRQLLAHHLSPLHLFAPLIRCMCTTGNPLTRRVLRSILTGYDRFFRMFCLPLLLL